MTLNLPVHIFTLILYKYMLHLFLSYTSFSSFGTFLTLQSKIISGNWPVHSFFNFIWCWNGEGHCFWLKMGYPWSWQWSRVHLQYRKACHPWANHIRLSPWHHMSWRQSCCCCVVSLLSLSSIHSSCISALSLNLEKSDNWKHLELHLVSSWF